MRYFGLRFGRGGRGRWENRYCVEAVLVLKRRIS
jgi:hypothetical protein